ncbi:2-oxoacid:acceptor oxidoreductase family protein [bacterium]|nr:2-oxoacid:acceptor oxidoreductase family protein [bacterium]
MKNIFEITWYGRGGLGAKTGAILLADAAITANKFVQAFPEYGPERQGAPIKVYNRISDDPVRVHTAITNPDFIIVIDPSLIESIDFEEELKDGGKILINTDKTPEEIKTKMKLGSKDANIYTIDATGISIKFLGKNIPNIPILGAFSDITKMIEIGEIKKHLHEKLITKYGQDIIDKNIQALEAAYSEVKQ